ncbi:MAG: NTP transferase domain-containing protein, partial [Bacteroidales bacterium]|nr:NTP transferase domain-containing protein [Bacteroidales bacterium]
MKTLSDVKAMIFAAGLGSRLKPITDTTPKALVKLDGITLLEYAIRKLKYYGICDIIINVHH